MTQFSSSPGFHHYEVIVQTASFDIVTYSNVPETDIILHNGVLEIRMPTITRVYPLSALYYFDIKLRYYEKDNKSFYPDGRPVFPR
jgi:hypothetical protein